MADTGKTIGLIKALASVDPEVIQSSVEGWLDDHPEATTTVQDGSITKAKLDQNLQSTVDDVGDLKSAINAMPEIKDSTATGTDLDISDESGHVIARFANGEIQTKNFNSSKTGQTETTSASNVDLDFSDTSGHIILRLKDGHLQTKFFDSSTVGMLEATGDTTDRSAEILTILQNNKVVTLGVGEFYISSSVTLPDGATIKGQGDSTVVKAGNSSMTSVFAMSDKTTIKDLSLVGTLDEKPNSMGTMHGITILGKNCNNRISNVNFTGFTGAGVYSIDTYTSNHNSNIIENCRFIYCGCGVYVGRRSEAFVVTGCVVLDSYIGVHCIGGNNRITADLIKGCYYGIDMTSASSTDNDGHTIFTGLTIIHNAHAVKANTIEVGSVFSGCTIFYGDISVVDSIGIMFIGCEMGSITAISATGSSAGARISNCIFHAMQSSVVSGFVVNDCSTLDGTSFSV